MSMESAFAFPFCQGLETDDFDDPRHDDKWGCRSTPLEDYGGAAQGNADLLDGFLNQLRLQPRGAVVDLAAGHNAVAARQILSNKLATRALFTNLADFRSNWLKLTQPIMPLDQITGNLKSADTWQRIAEWRDKPASRGFRGVMFNPHGAFMNLPDSFYVGAAHQLVDWTAPGGALLLQIPRGMSAEAQTHIAHRGDIAEARVLHSHDALLVKAA